MERIQLVLMGYNCIPLDDGLGRPKHVVAVTSVALGGMIVNLYWVMVNLKRNGGNPACPNGI
jgi:hypothetical protein